MTPELSRRLAWVMNMAVMPPSSRLDFLHQVKGAETFKDLPDELAKFVLAIEAKYGTNPNL